MIQATTETNFTTFLQTEDNRINFHIPYNRVDDTIKHLFKFTNDMDGSVVYSYAATEVINPRVTKFTFTYNASSEVLEGLVNLRRSKLYSKRKKCSELNYCLWWNRL